MGYSIEYPAAWHTNDVQGRGFQANSDVLDQMISSLDFSAPAPERAGNGEAGDG